MTALAASPMVCLLMIFLLSVGCSKLEAADRHAAIDDQHLAHDIAGGVRTEPYGRRSDLARLSASLGRNGGGDQLGEGWVLCAGGLHQDRKSTRLNSSH